MALLPNASSSLASATTPPPSDPQSHTHDPAFVVVAPSHTHKRPKKPPTHPPLVLCFIIFSVSVTRSDSGPPPPRSLCEKKTAFPFFPSDRARVCVVSVTMGTDSPCRATLSSSTLSQTYFCFARCSVHGRRSCASPPAAVSRSVEVWCRDLSRRGVEICRGAVRSPRSFVGRV